MGCARCVYLCYCCSRCAVAPTWALPFCRTGYSEVTFSGEAVTDEVLVNIARANGPNLVSIKLLGTSCVTDAGIIALVRSAPRLKIFMLEDAGMGVAGAFVPVILQSCRQLETLHIEGAEAVSWADLRQSGAWWLAHQQAAAIDNTQQSAAAAAGAAGASSSVSSGLSSRADAGGASPSSHAALQQQDLQGVAGSGPSSSSADGTMMAHHHLHHRHHHRLSSDASDTLSDDEDSDDGSVGAASDSTSISVPAATTAALAVQLQSSSLQDNEGSSRQAALLHQQQVPPQPAADSQQQPSLLQHHQGVPSHAALRRLHVRFANVDNLQQLLERCPGLTDLQLDGPAVNIDRAALACPNIKRLAFLVGSQMELDAALFYLNGMRSLRGLELEVKGMMLTTEQLRVSSSCAAACGVCIAQVVHIQASAVNIVSTIRLAPNGQG